MANKNMMILGRKLDAFLYLRELIASLENGVYDYGKEAAELRVKNQKETIGISSEGGLEEAKLQLLKDFQQSLLVLDIIKYEDFGMNYKSEVLTLTAYSYTTKTTYEVTYELGENLKPKIVFHSASWQSRHDGIGKGTLNVDAIE